MVLEHEGTDYAKAVQYSSVFVVVRLEHAWFLYIPLGW